MYLHIVTCAEGPEILETDYRENPLCHGGNASILTPRNTTLGDTSLCVKVQKTHYDRFFYPTGISPESIDELIISDESVLKLVLN